MPKLPLSMLPTKENMIRRMVDDAHPVAKAYRLTRYNLSNPSTIPRERGEALLKEAEKYQKELEAKSLEEIQEIRRQQSQQRNAQIEAERFFNRPDAEAEYSHWAKMTQWTFDETISLSMGKDPRKVTEQKLKSHFERSYEYTDSPFVKEYKARRTLFMRELSQIGYTSTYEYPKRCKQYISYCYPAKLFQFMKTRGIEYPQQLEDEYNRIHGAIKDYESLYKQAVEKIDQQQSEIQQLQQDVAFHKHTMETLKVMLKEAQQEPNKTALAKERATFQKLIATMATKGYSYNPHASKNGDAISDIEGDMVQLEIPISKDSIREYLKAAVKLIPQNALETAD